MATTRAEKLGKLGETTLGAWAAQAEMICTRTSDDRRGWDFLLEIPLIQPSRQPAGTSAVQDCQCFIQVKSTQRSEDSWNIKLSNWKRLVETTLPAFFLVLRFNDANECTDAFLSHVWEAEIGRLAERIWKLAMSDKPLLLHKHWMQLTWGEEERLRQPSGDALRESILSVVVGSPSDYARRKADLKRASGLASGRGRVTLRIAVPEEYQQKHPHELLVDALLGLTAFPKVVGGEITHVQYPIPSVTTHKLSGESRVILGPTRAARRAQLVLTTSDREHQVALPAEVRGPSGFAQPVHPSAQKLLFTLPHTKLVFAASASIGRFHFNIPDLEETTSLSDAMHLARLLEFVEAADTTVDVSFGGRHIGTLDLHDSHLEQDVIRWMELVNTADAACSEFGLPRDITITTRSLLEQQSALDSLAIALPGCTVNSPAFTFSLDEGSPEPVLGGQMCMPIYVDLTLGVRRVVAFESLLGEYRGERSASGELVVRVDRGEFEKVLKLAPEDDLPQDRISYLDEIARRRAKEGDVLCWWRQDAVEAPAG